VSKTGGHLGSSLGVVELTVALHHVFNAPADKILWDVGHQACLLALHITCAIDVLLLFAINQSVCPSLHCCKCRDQ